MVTPKLRQRLLASFGSACARCGYSKCQRALHFHHVDPSCKKDWSGSNSGKASLREVESHPERFLLLCANCHIEEHFALADKSKLRLPCGWCGKEMIVTTRQLNVGRGRFCSRRCARLRPSGTYRERFWKHVHADGDCWLWTAHCRGGVPVLGGRSESGAHTILPARRIAFELSGRPLTRDEIARRTCDSPTCVNPAHLRIAVRRSRTPRDHQKLGTE